MIRGRCFIHHIRRKGWCRARQAGQHQSLWMTRQINTSRQLSAKRHKSPSCEYQQSRKQNRHSPEPIGQYARNRRRAVASANVKQTTTMPASAMLRPNVRAIAGMTGRISVTPKGA